MQQVAPLVNPATVDAELAWRWPWLAAGQYAPPTHEADQAFHDPKPTPPRDDSGRGAADTEDDPAGAWKE
ncbi:MAG TPA: hypothetical protein VFZ66_13675 [Herpetosiphonaceae bacterium]